MINSGFNPSNTSQYEKSKLNKAATSNFKLIPAGTTSSIDILMADDVLIADGESHMLVDGSVRGDTWSMQVVHPVAGVIFQPVTNWYIDWTVKRQVPPRANFPAKIPGGLTLRIVYTSVGTTDVWIAVNTDKDMVMI